jgi:tetratricopeptide (TPR) repeat protein
MRDTEMVHDSKLVDIWSAYLDSAKKAYQRGDIDEAERELRQNLAQLEAIVHNRQIVMSEVLLQLANIYREKENFEAAEHYYQLAFELRVDEAQDMPTAPVLEGLSLNYALQGKYSDARRIEQMLYKMHTAGGALDNGRCLLRLGIICWLDDDIADAAQFLSRYLVFADTRKPSADYNVMAVREMFARCLYKLKDYAKAEEQYRQIIQVKEQSGKPDDEQCRRAMHALGLTLCAMGRNREGQPICQRALAIGQTTGDEGILHDLADVFCSHNRFFEARPLCEIASDAQPNGESNDLSSKSAPLAEHARMLAAVGLTEEAELLMRRARRSRPIAV